MAGKKWTKEQREKIAKAKSEKKVESKPKEKEVLLNPLSAMAPNIINWQGANMVSANEVMSEEELAEHQVRVQRANKKREEQEAQVKKVNDEKALVKDNALSFTNEVTDERGITTKYVINDPKNVPQGTIAKYATVAELVKEMELRGASADQISAAIDNFTGGGMQTPSMNEIDKLNTYNRKPQVVTQNVALPSNAVFRVNEQSVSQPQHIIKTGVSEKELPNETQEQQAHALRHQQELGKGKLWLLFPCFSDTNAATTWALVITAKKYGDKISMDMESGDSMIVNSRNKLANRFLETGAEWSVWLDSDMIPPVGNPEWFRYMTFCDEWADAMGVQKIPQQILETHFIDRLLSHGQKLVGSMYVGRQLRGRPMFNEGVNTVAANREARSYPNQLFPTEWVGTGCMLVHRSVYVEMQNNYPELAPTEEMPQWDFFRLIPGRGEDASFCSRALKLGIQPYVDLGLHCAHVGKASYGPWNTNNKQLGV